jgi:hypothetical protein
MRRIGIVGVLLALAAAGSQTTEARAGVTEVCVETTSECSAQPPAFYPIVNDGYRDSALIQVDTYDGLYPSTVTITSQETDQVVRSISIPGWSSDSQGDYALVNWDGRDDAGDRVPVGSYTVGTDASGGSGSATVDVATGYRKVVRRIHRAGWRKYKARAGTGGVSHRSGTAWYIAGAGSRVSYRFVLPKNRVKGSLTVRWIGDTEFRNRLAASLRHRPGTDTFLKRFTITRANYAAIGALTARYAVRIRI